MTTVEMIKKIEEYNEMESLLAEVKAEADKIKDEIKAELEANETEEMVVGNYIVRNTSCLTMRFDTKRFKEKFEELYKTYTKEVSSKRFSIVY